jgi:DNA helicase-2/ATP-dependent DNA helicase PcrA
MVDKQARRAAAYRRETTWDGDDDWSSAGQRGARRAPGGGWGGERAQPRNPYNWSQGTTGGSRGDTGERIERPTPDKAGQGKANYWSPGGASSGKPAKPGADRPTQFKRRDSVQHPTFGVGTVIESVASGGDEEVTVAFPGVGIKKLLASVAGLKKL